MGISLLIARAWAPLTVLVTVFLNPFVYANFPIPYNSERDTNSSPLAPGEAAAAISLPPGFKASVFAAEPDVNNPIAMAWDRQGRLWVAENYTYAEYTVRFDLSLRDRILIFEEGDDGKFSSRRVFADTFQRLTSIEIGHGGVWAMCPPQLLFIPDGDGDGVPDGPAVVVLDGFDVPGQSHHTIANGLKFGPDGWLYGRIGSSSPGEVGIPGSPPSERIPVRGSIWRYHPHWKIFETLGGGSTNPWGHDWDEHGELFFINTVNGHLWHSIAGAHYRRAPYPNHAVYAQIPHHADHWHFDTGQRWQDSRDGAANSLGGGHAHVGMTIYQGDNFPEEYRGRLFTINIHGLRANQEILERSGTGYVGRHGPDLFVAGDPWFRGQELSYGPDGGLYVLDWTDTGECHEATGVHRTSGRIFKIVHGDPAYAPIGDLSRMTSRELAALHIHPNEWFVRQARLVLIERSRGGERVQDAVAALRDLYHRHLEVPTKLRALWTLYGMGAADETFLRGQLRHENEHVRVWAIRLLSDRWPMDTAMSGRPPREEAVIDAGLLNAFVAMATGDESGLVRLTLASLMQRLPPALRIDLAKALGSHEAHADDHNLPLMLWYGLVPVAEAEPDALVAIAGACELPRTRRYIARRLAEGLEESPARLDRLLAISLDKSPSFRADIIAGISEGLAGWRKVEKPPTWARVAERVASEADGEVLEHVRELAVLFGDGRALEEVRAVALDTGVDMPTRRAALQTLVASEPPDLREICERLLVVRGLNAIAVRGLARFSEPAVGETIAKHFRYFLEADRDAVVAILVERPAFARALVAEVAAGRVPRTAISPFHARQIRNFSDADLSAELTAAWGETREPAEDKRALIAALKEKLTPERLGLADPSRGRVVYANLCGACHVLYGEGGRLGPDLTGSGRGNLDYLLEHTVDPNAVVSADYRLNVVTLRDGRVLSGFIAGKTARTLTLNTMTDQVTLELTEIESQQALPQSLMPDGLLESVSEQEMVDLIAYLLQPVQVPLPGGGR